MKVLVIPSWYPPNGGYFFREHSQAIAALGVKVDVLACHFRSLKTYNPFRIISKETRKSLIVTKEENITEHSGYTWIIPFTEEPNFKTWIRKAWDMYYRYIQTNGKPDIIQAHSSLPAGYLAYLIKKRHNIPYVLTEHRSRFIYNSDNAKKMFRQWHYPIIKQALDGCSSLVGVSNALFPKLHEISESARSKSLVIHNMVDTDFFNITNQHSERYQTKPFRFSTVALLKEVKGIDILLEAFNIIHKSEPGKYLLNIAGEGVCREKLEKYVLYNKLNKHVNFLGSQTREQVKNLMQNSDAFVLPSRFEAFGVVFIEAMACGLPVIATKAGGPETFIPDFAGKLSEVDDIEALANNMKQVADNYESYQAKKIRDYTVANFSKPVVAEKYISLYAEALKKPTN